MRTKRRVIYELSLGFYLSYTLILIISLFLPWSGYINLFEGIFQWEFGTLETITFMLIIIAIGFILAFFSIYFKFRALFKEILNLRMHYIVNQTPRESDVSQTRPDTLFLLAQTLFLGSCFGLFWTFYLTGNNPPGIGQNLYFFTSLIGFFPIGILLYTIFAFLDKSH